MPTLHWIGKEKVINHHQDVPYRVLEHKYGFKADTGQQTEDTNSGNLILHGDNLEALKSLLPKYEGKVKCVCIDPPYNTGNEGWAYNDNVNDPKIRRWLETTLKAKENGKDAPIGLEDLARHDKWLCMIYPRLKLIHKLLAEDGLIFISLDDNEIHFFRIVMNEIFGETNFQAEIIVQSNKRGQTYKQIAKTHEYLLCFSKSDKSQIHEIPAEIGNYPYKDSIGNFSIRELRNRNPKFGKFNRPNLFFPIYLNPDAPDENGFCPISIINSETFNIEVLPLNSENNESCWRWGKPKVEENVINPTDTTSVFARQKQTGEWGIFEKYRKTTKKEKTIWFDSDVISEQGTSLLKEIGLGELFQFPKPLALIEKCLLLCGNEKALVLDSFAGSGTTAHAVLNLNKLDGGNRKFILVEMEDYAETITAERVKRVIDGYSDKEGTGGGFDYYELGKPLFVGDNSEFLNEEVETEKIREYVWYSETRTAYEKPVTETGNSHYLGVKDETAYYFIYAKGIETTLDFDTLATITTKAGQYVVYADNCLLPKDFMMKQNIIFKKIPRDVTRF